MTQTEMSTILEEPNPEKRDAMVGELSGDDAQQMLKALMRAMKRLHDMAWYEENAKK